MRRILLALVLLTTLSAGASTYTVTNLDDAGDAVPGDDVCDTGEGPCTLRAAIEEANAHAGADTIEFAVAGTITPATALPAVTQPVTIDGTTAPALPPSFVIDGAGSIAVGLHFDIGSNGSTLRALTIHGFTTAGVVVDSNFVQIESNHLGPVTQGTPNGDGLQLNGSGSTVQGNLISGNDRHGIAATGSGHEIFRNLIGITGAGDELGNGDDGINVSGGATNITIGSFAEENTIAGNFDAGVSIDDGSGIVVEGNYIGVTLFGDAIPNFTGVVVDSAGNTIGTMEAGNVISGNFDDGIDIFASDTIVENNIVGLDPTGTTGVFNGGFGIFAGGVSNVTIGGGIANVVSFNAGEGIFLFEVDDSIVSGNIVGLNAAGTDILGNGFEGILLLDTSGVTVASNVVSGNSFAGIVDAAGVDNVIGGNRVGTSADGQTGLGNLGTGIEVAASTGTLISNNLVSGNDGHGIETTLGSSGVVMHSNVVGLREDQTAALGNTLDGINVCDGASDTVVGSVALGGNIISGNDENGIGIEPTALTGNTWAANSIYDNGLLGIDLEIDGVTANDQDDPDEGPNELQNYPELTSALTSGAASEVRGTLNTEPSTAFTIHFYSSPAADPSGFGEGRTYLGATSGTTDAGGDAAFAFAGPPLTAGHVVTATATTDDGTSEFSAFATVATFPVISFSSETYTAGESDGTVTITVTRGGNLDVVSTVNYTTSDNTAAAGADYTTASGTLTFEPGDASETFDVTILNDTLDEPDELVQLTLSNPVSATLAAPSAQLTITDDDDPPAISIEDVTLDEGNGGTTAFTFELTLSAASSFVVTVDYETANGTALASADYASDSGTVTFGPGVTSRSVTVDVTGDTTFEADEDFFVNLTDPVNASIGDTQAAGTIANDDGQPEISIGSRTLAEGDGGTTNFVFDVTLSNASDTTVTVDFTTADDSATSPDDYATTPGTLTFDPGETLQQITVPVAGDTTFESNEVFFVNLTTPSGATILDNQGLGTITNDDGVPEISIDNVTLVEGDGGTTSFTFNVTLSAASDTPITVDYDTADDTAAAPDDYVAESGQVTFAPGVLAQTIEIAVNGETLVETDETFFVDLTNPEGASLTDDQGLGTIENDDEPPPPANLEITKTTPTTTFTPGQQVTYTITVTNLGPGTASSVTVTDVLPAGATFVSVSSPDAVCGGTTTVTCTMGPVPEGDPAVITLVIEANGSAPISNTATITASSPPDAEPSNNTSTAVISPAASAGPTIPTASEWGLMLLAVGVAAIAMKKLATF
ncbi:MAG TPA: Calx-beta domain-containing protein [Thermoanaerobaculia bacterium]|nr:Calx-beta domain-containing protein [Thermoanaerobaculia bacterium]